MIIIALFIGVYAGFFIASLLNITHERDQEK